jgi:N-acyl-D-amino-acid deacylase
MHASATTYLASTLAPIDAKGLAVAPGFINMLSHSEVSLIVDGRSMGELKQGITTQIVGEFSMGPLDEDMKRRIVANQGDIKSDIQ